jgi:HEAT repeat protein
MCNKNVLHLSLLIIFSIFIQVFADTFKSEDLERIRLYRFGDDQAILVYVEQSLAATTATKRKIMIGQLGTLLQSNADYAAKQFICRQMARYGDAGNIDVLASLLLDESLSDMARYALARIPDKKVDEVLSAALAKAPDDIKIGLLSTIGERGVTNAYNKLGKYLYDKNPQIVSSSAAALGKIGDEKAANLLTRALKDIDTKYYPITADALLVCASNFVSAGHNSRALSIYQKLFKPAAPPQIRAAALRGIQISADGDTFSIILESLSDENSLVSGTAARLSLRYPGEEYTNLIAGQFDRLNNKAKIQVLYALKDRKDSTALSTVQEAGTNSSKEVRIAALTALASLGDASYLPLLIDRIEKTSGEEQQAAREALHQIEVEDLSAKINPLLGTTNNSEKIILLDLVTYRKPGGVIDNVFILTGDSNHQVRQAAYKAIGQIAEERHLDRMLDLWEETPDKEIRSAEDMVVKYGKRLGQDDQPAISANIQPDWLTEGFGVKLHGNDKKFTAALLERAYTDGLTIEKRRSLIRIMGRMGDDRSLSFLETQLKDEDDDISAEAIRALSAWPNHTPLQDLWEVISQTKNETNKILALRGFIALIPYKTEDAIKNYNLAYGIASDSEKRGILGQLSRMKSFAAFDLAARYIEDKSLEQEAAQAAIAISHRVYQNHLESVEKVMRDIIALSPSDNINSQARYVMEKISTARDFKIEKRLNQIQMVYLFDGQTLTNWEGNPDYFRVEENCIVAGSLKENIPENEFLCSIRSYDDFELKLKFKLIGPKEHANAGIQIRSRRIPNDNEMIGYQADIGQQYWGSLYDESRRRKIIAQADKNLLKKAIHPDTWNEYTIRCVGNRVQLWLNGYKTVDYLEVDESIEQTGVIGLQIHSGPPVEIWYKDITIKEIPRIPQFRKHIVNKESQYEAATFIDINKNGKLDLFCGGFWYQAPHWQKHFAREVKEQDGYYLDFAAIPIDVDQDGWMDIVNGSWHGKDVFWLQNDYDSGHKFKKIPIDNPGNLETILALDLSGDNSLDLLPNTVRSLIWYEYNSTLPEKWEKHELQKEAAGHGVGAGDVNNDGRIDIITPKGWLQQPADYKNDWSWHQEFNLTGTSVPILVHDVDGDSDSDLIWGDGHGYGIFWLEQKSDPDNARNWTKHVIDLEWSQAHFLVIKDLDGDGRKELITGKRVRAHNGKDPGGYDPPCVYFYKFNAVNRNWDRFVISERENIGFGIYSSAEDYDGDGDIDILAPGKSGLYLFENLFINIR